ncbi:sensitivity to high expression protein she9 [Coemansia sp. RSA 552]|nr:sensitivity to high expression protein she9 [Coemansia sp. RSA 552]
MSVGVRRVQTLAFRHYGRLVVTARRYTTADAPQQPKPPSSKESVESELQRILGPKPTSASPGAKELALVPLNVIYLPPPPWHQPIELRTRRSRDQARSKADSPLKQETTGSAAGTKSAGSGSHHSSGKEGPGLDEPGGGTAANGRPIGFLLRLGQMFRFGQAEKPARVASAPDAVSRISAEKWEGSAVLRLLGAWRRMGATVRELPKDDDWVTWAGKVLNGITGYDRVAELKLRVETTGNEFHAARRALEGVKAQHTRATKGRIANQREINGLLQRKHMWSEEDVARFTSLYRDEHQAEGMEHQTAGELKEAESLVDRRYDQLVNAIRERYHEEQIWSDKIRRASTYGTWAVLFMNILALFMAQAIFEPRKRRKIVAGVDDRLCAAMEQQRAVLDTATGRVQERLGEQEAVSRQMAQHLFNMSTQMAAIEAQLQGVAYPAAHAGIDPTLLLAEDRGYSDTELDMYYAQQQAEQQQAEQQTESHSRIPGSVIWKMVRGNGPDGQKPRGATYTRAEAGQLALETATVTGIVAGVAAYIITHS